MKRPSPGRTATENTEDTEKSLRHLRIFTRRGVPLSGWFIILLSLALVSTLLAQAAQDKFVFLPVVYKPQPTPTPTATPTPSPTPTIPATMVEFRGIWVTRFEWANSSATPATIDAIVNDIADAGFNVIFFQVRGEADAFYNSSVEPWSQRLTGTLGQNPGWDPLARMIQQAHARGIQVHAYINVYPVWLGCTPPPSGTNPLHLYYQLQTAHGTTNGKLNGLQWNTSDEVGCGSYLRASPASIFLDNHLMAVATDLVTNYDVDGLHLDHIRYDFNNVSCDPVSEGRYGTDCFGFNEQESYADWQRRQVNGTVQKFYEQIVP